MNTTVGCDDHKRRSVILKDIVVVENRFPEYDIGAAILEDFEGHRDMFTRLEGPVCMDLSHCFLVGTICKLKYLPMGGPFANVKAVRKSETGNQPVSSSTVKYLGRRQPVIHYIALRACIWYSGDRKSVGISTDLTEKLLTVAPKKVHL